MAYLLTQLAQQSAERYPDHPAIVHEDVPVTYAELEIATNQVAQHLITSGVQHGDRVGVFLPKSSRKVIALLGIMKAGAAYVPLDPDMPASRVVYILQDCGIQCLITSASQWQRLAPSDTAMPTVQLILTDEMVPETAQVGMDPAITWADIQQQDDEPPHIPAFIESDLAYILYTSGSTGNPKGVMLSHRAALTFVDWAHETFGVTHKDRLSSHAPFHFDLSIFDLYVTFKAGATVHLLSSTLSIFPLALAQYIAVQRLTVWYSVPSILIKLVQHGELVDHDFSALRCVLFAGEVFPIRYLRQLVQMIPHPEYVNLYGPTETNVITHHYVQPNDIVDDVTHPLPIGVACANSHVFALKEDGSRAAVGEQGELVVRGPTLMRGYWGLPERTAQSLIEQPVIAGLDAEKLYRTGDRVEVGTNGRFHFLGRLDNMIKSRGYRIELGEIETALYNHPDIAEVAVLAIPDEEVSHRLSAAIVLRTESQITITKIKTYLTKQLPKYMMPDSFHFINQLPQTSTGKTDRQALMAMLWEDHPTPL
ncbi:MAG: amino acid adenylation domain-containing protein [Chloroflexota bacterium]